VIIIAAYYCTVYDLKLQIMKLFMQTLENAIFGEFNGNNSALSQ